MGLITESVTLPMKVSGSYRAPKGDGDALHSFDRRKSDKFGGYMLRGGPIPPQFQSVVTLDQGKGINQVLDELIKSGVIKLFDFFSSISPIFEDSVFWYVSSDITCCPVA